MQPYTETQLNKYRWHSLIFSAVVMGGFLYFIIKSDLSEADSGFVAKVMAGGILFYLFLISCWLFQRLDTRIDDEGVHFRAPYSFARWQHIPWQEINRLYVREVALIGEYPKGLLGIRQGPNGFAYAPRMGLFGLQIEKTTGGKYLLGTQQQDLLSAYLLNREAANPVSAA